MATGIIVINGIHVIIWGDVCLVSRSAVRLGLILANNSVEAEFARLNEVVILTQTTMFFSTVAQKKKNSAAITVTLSKHLFEGKPQSAKHGFLFFFF